MSYWYDSDTFDKLNTKNNKLDLHEVSSLTYHEGTECVPPASATLSPFYRDRGRKTLKYREK